MPGSKSAYVRACELVLLWPILLPLVTVLRFAFPSLPHFPLQAQAQFDTQSSGASAAVPADVAMAREQAQLLQRASALLADACPCHASFLETRRCPPPLP